MAWATPRSYQAQGFHFSLSLDLVPAKVLRAGSSDYLWPSMSEPQLGLLLHRAGPGGKEATLQAEKQLFFGLSEPAPSWRKLTFLGKPVEVGSQPLQGESRRPQTCLIPLSAGGWLFVAVTTAPGIEPALATTVWEQLSRSLKQR